MPANGKSQPTGRGVVPPLASICLIAMPLLGAVLVIVAVLWVALPRIQSSLEPTHYGMKPAAYDELNAANSEHLAILRIGPNMPRGEKSGAAGIAPHLPASCRSAHRLRDSRGSGFLAAPAGRLF